MDGLQQFLDLCKCNCIRSDGLAVEDEVHLRLEVGRDLAVDRGSRGLIAEKHLSVGSSNRIIGRDIGDATKCNGAGSG